MLIKPEHAKRELLMTRTGCVWFLFLNIAFSLYLITRHAFHETAQINTHAVLWLSLVVLGFSLWNLLLTAIISRHGFFVRRSLLLINVLLYGIIWALLLHTLYKTLATYELIFLLSLLMIFAASIAFHLSGALIAAFTLPVALIVIGEVIVIGMKANLFMLFSYGVALLIVLSSRVVLMEWFRKSQESEKQNNLLIQRLTDLADRDGLTGLVNKRYLREYFQLKSAQNALNRSSIYLIMIDVDFFKAYNDLYGHLTGDECLKQVADCIKASIRDESDLAVRFGGEEFAVLLLATDKAGALAVCQRIQQNIADAAIVHEGSAVNKHVTVSQGVARLHNGASLDALIEAADRQLYYRKQHGRNSYSVADK